MSETPRRPDEPDELPGERPDEHRAERRLTRSRSNRIIAGLGAGLGYYFGVDPVAIRIAFVVLALAGGGGVLLYVLGWIFIPEEEPGTVPPPGRRTTGSPGIRPESSLARYLSPSA